MLLNKIALKYHIKIEISKSQNLKIKIKQYLHFIYNILNNNTYNNNYYYVYILSIILNDSILDYFLFILAYSSLLCIIIFVVFLDYLIFFLFGFAFHFLPIPKNLDNEFPPRPSALDGACACACAPTRAARSRSP
jgi:hypothetical protein